MEIKQSGRLCNICLKESETPDVCSFCGSKIELTDFSTARFIPPKYGRIFIPRNLEIPDLELFISRAIDFISNKYYQSYRLVDGDLDNIILSCRYVSGEKMVDYLNEKFFIKGIDFKASYVEG